MRQNKYVLWIASVALCASVTAEPKSASFPKAFQDNTAQKAINKSKSSRKARVRYTPTAAFTGKILGKKVRLRAEANIESHVVSDLTKGDMLIVVGENEDFYACEAPSDLKAHIFRIFVLDGVVEGKRVNVRLHPDLSSPIIGHLHTGDKIENAAVSEKNRKWLSITPPRDSVFFVAKEFIENIGNRHVKTIHDKKKTEVTELFDQAELFANSEMIKYFEDIDFARTQAGYEAIIKDYSEFEQYVTKSREKLVHLKQDYLQKKLAYLEIKTSKTAQNTSYRPTSVFSYSGVDKMKHFEPVEAALYQKWAHGRQDVTIKDFYEDQKLKSTVISGIIEPYNEGIRKKPGNYIIRNRDLPTAYLYSTIINLDQYIGKQVDILVAERPNNNFAFNAYFAIGVE